MPTAEQAHQWIERWDRQQERYVADREERFTVIGDVIDGAVGRPDPVIVDLGAGPGSLSVRLRERFPQATVIAVDGDPLLLGLARAAHGLTTVEVDLRAPDWTTHLGVDEVDAVVSTTALHWLTGDELATVYDACARLLRPGGVFVDGDHADSGDPALDRIARHVRDERARRVGVLEHEEWDAWWSAVGAARELVGLVGERGARPIDHHVADVPTLPDHERLLRAAGFATVGVVWQHGDDRVLTAVR